MRSDTKSPFAFAFGPNGVQFIPRYQNSHEKSSEALNEGIEEALPKSDEIKGTYERRKNLKGVAKNF